MEFYRNKSYNHGMELLKLILSYLVVCCHFGYTNAPDLILQIREFAVPCFMFISFVFVGKSLSEKGLRLRGIIDRLKRLLIPLWGWSIIIFLLYELLSRFTSIEKDVCIQDLLWQLAFGHNGHINSALWFLFDQIVIYVVFSMVFLFPNKLFQETVMIFCVFGGLFLQYSGINLQLFGSLDGKMSYPLGRLSEMIPYAGLGILLGMNGLFNLLEKTKCSHKREVLACIACGSFFWLFDVVSTPSGFFYQGLRKIVCTICIVVIIGNINVQLPKRLEYFLYRMSKLTLGIYCIHNPLGQLMGFSATTNFRYNIAIWAISLLVSWLISLIPNKFIRGLVM